MVFWSGQKRQGHHRNPLFAFRLLLQPLLDQVLRLLDLWRLHRGGRGRCLSFLPQQGQRRGTCSNHERSAVHARANDTTERSGPQQGQRAGHGAPAWRCLLTGGVLEGRAHPFFANENTSLRLLPQESSMTLWRGTAVVYFLESPPLATATSASSGGRNALKRFLSMAFM